MLPMVLQFTINNMGLYRTQNFAAIKNQTSSAVSTQRQNNLKAIVTNFITYFKAKHSQ